MKTVWIDGALVPAEQATVSAYDRAFRSGEGVFETFRTYGRFVFRMDEHLQRAAFGASVLGFDLPAADELARAVQATVDANTSQDQPADVAVRLVATPGDIDPDSPFPGRPVGNPRVVVTVHDLAAQPVGQGMSAVVVPWGREVAHVKAVSYLASLLARRQARERGADDALLTDGDDHVLEASGANVFAVVGGTLVTPPVDGSILPGVTRGVLLEVAGDLGIPSEQRPLPLAELLDADEAMLTATTREVLALVTVEGQDIGTGRPGALTTRLQAGFRALVLREAESARG